MANIYSERTLLPLHKTCLTPCSFSRILLSIKSSQQKVCFLSNSFKSFFPGHLVQSEIMLLHMYGLRCTVWFTHALFFTVMYTVYKLKEHFFFFTAYFRKQFCTCCAFWSFSVIVKKIPATCWYFLLLLLQNFNVERFYIFDIVWV